MPLTRGTPLARTPATHSRVPSSLVPRSEAPLQRRGKGRRAVPPAARDPELHVVAEGHVVEPRGAQRVDGRDDVIDPYAHLRIARDAQPVVALPADLAEHGAGRRGITRPAVEQAG